MTPFNASQSAKKNPRSIIRSTPRVLLAIPYYYLLSLLFCVGQWGGDGVSHHNQCACPNQNRPLAPPKMAGLSGLKQGLFPFSFFLFFPFFFSLSSLLFLFYKIMKKSDFPILGAGIGDDRSPDLFLFLSFFLKLYLPFFFSFLPFRPHYKLFRPLNSEKGMKNGFWLGAFSPSLIQLRQVKTERERKKE